MLAGAGMISVHQILIYCGIYAIAIAVPGPGIVAIVARALKEGMAATVPAVIGNTLGDIILMSLSVFGLAFIAHALGGLFLIVKWAGAAYLVYLGYRYWTAPIAGAGPPQPANRGFVSQLALTLGNPKAIVMFVALLPSVVDLNHLNWVGYGELCACTLVLIPGIEFAYAALAAQARVLLSGAVARKRMNKTAGAIMIGAGIGIVAN
jgi:threonine/homoserine/homoserine lactone efflux protein